MKKNALHLGIVLLSIFLAGCSGTTTQTVDDQSASAKAETEGKQNPYPEKPIELIVPYSAGGAVDLVARAVASVLPTYMDGATITVTNVTGGNGVVGVTQLMNEKSDGYKLAVYASPVFEITPFMNEVSYTMDDFTFLGSVVQRPNVLVVHSTSGWGDLDSFIDHVKNNPGTTYGDPAAGSAHLGFEALRKAAGLDDMKFVPYSGGTGEAITALLGKHIDCTMALPSDTFEYIRSGDLKALCVLSDERIDILPDVPTAKELGYDVNIGLTNGFIAPKDLDPEIAAYISDALKQAVDDPKVLELDPGDEGMLVFINGEDTKELLFDTSESFQVLIEELGLAKE